MTPQPPGTWPAPGGNWEGGTVYQSRRLHHTPNQGWVDAGPATTSPFLPPPPAQLPACPVSTATVSPAAGQRIHYGGRYPRRRHLLARWLRARSSSVVAATSVLVVVGYAVTLAVCLDRMLPTFELAAALVAVGAVLVMLLLSVVLWAHGGDGD
jgi:hypothetical protein